MRNLLLIRKYCLLRPRAVKAYRDMMARQTLSVDELDAINWRKRQKLIQHAYQNVPFYRARLDSYSIHPKDLRQPGDFLRLPTLSRADIREQFQDLVAENVPSSRRRLASTGGSTGEPLKVFHDLRSPTDAIRWRMLHWFGLTPAVDMARVWRIPERVKRQRAWRDLALLPIREHLLDASHLTDSSMRDYVRTINRYRPQLLQGYVGGIDHLASFIERERLAVYPFSAVWTTSAPLTKVQRNRIEHVFQAPVFDQYGSCEVLYIAAQCVAGGALHRLHDVCHVEFLDEHDQPVAPGSIGEIAVTDLENFAFPLIRYRLGDRGREIPGTCDCGLTMPLMDSVKGRMSDNLHMPNGATLSGEYLTTLFDDFPDAIRAFQVIQRRDYSLVVRFVAAENREKTSIALKAVSQELRQKTDDQVPVTMEEAEAIEHDRGKLRFVLSELKHAPQCQNA